MKILIFQIVALLSLTSHGQHPLVAFDNLVGSSWVSEGIQLGGFEGRTVYQVASGLDGKIIKVKTYATDPNTKEFGLRNEGIRAYDVGQAVIKFYEFDKLGGITVGTVTADDKNLHFDYEYKGMKLRDSWIFEDKDQYRFIVGSWDGKHWIQKFHETRLVRK